jgi:hypothetical protein
LKRLTFHPDAPKKLVRAFRRAGTYHATAEALGVNVRYVHDLLRHGVQPKNEEVRIRLFLPKHPHRAPRPQQERRPDPEELRWWKRLPGSERHGLIKSLFEIKDSLDEEDK